MLTPAEQSDNPSTSIYSQMVASGPLVFLAGHIPIRTTLPGKPSVATYEDVPPEGRILETGRSHPDARDGPIAAQSWFIYNEIRRTLENHGMTMTDIVHVRVYLADPRDLATFHRIHTHFFGDKAPALSIVGFDEVGHKNSYIEIEPTALIPGTLARANVDWPCPAPHAGPAAVRTGPLLMFSGMLGLDSEGQIARGDEHIPGNEAELVQSLEPSASDPSVPAQIWWAWKRVQDSCLSAGIGIESIAKTVVYLRSETDVPVYEAIRSIFMQEDLPAFDCLIVPNPGPVEEAAVQMDVTALIAN